MNVNISKYFWDLNQTALKETKKILRDPRHPKFIPRIVTFLSRCDKPKELFSVIAKKKFIEIWPKIRVYWMRRERLSNFRDWWQTIYEQLLEEYKLRIRKTKGRPPVFFQKLGRVLREARIKKGLSQKELALHIGMRQPDISRIEEGKENITLYTLLRLCKVLEIKKIDMT